MRALLVASVALFFTASAAAAPPTRGVVVPGKRLGGLSLGAIFTLWRPPGWRTSRGLQVGDPAARIAGLYGPLLRVGCGTYAAQTLRRGRTTTAFYVVDEQVWGFGLSRPGQRVCR